MNIRKTDEFIADLERQFEWYVVNAGREIGDRYLDSVAATCNLLRHHPLLGQRGDFKQQRLLEWRFFLVRKPFHKHILFYEVLGDELIFRRALHGHRDLPGMMIEPPQE